MPRIINFPVEEDQIVIDWKLIKKLVDEIKKQGVKSLSGLVVESW